MPWPKDDVIEVCRFHALEREHRELIRVVNMVQAKSLLRVRVFSRMTASATTYECSNAIDVDFLPLAYY